jgi:hypothetical protein
MLEGAAGDIQRSEIDLHSRPFYVRRLVGRIEEIDA